MPQGNLPKKEVLPKTVSDPGYKLYLEYFCLVGFLFQEHMTLL